MTMCNQYKDHCMAREVAGTPPPPQLYTNIINTTPVIPVSVCVDDGWFKRPHLAQIGLRDAGLGEAA